MLSLDADSKDSEVICLCPISLTVLGICTEQYTHTILELKARLWNILALLWFKLHKQIFNLER